MLTVEKTPDYVQRWVAAFESKDLDRVLAFYTDDVIFHSPLVARLSHDPSGTVHGKEALRAYVKKSFEVFDHIALTVRDVLRGVDSIAPRARGRSLEFGVPHGGQRAMMRRSSAMVERADR